jgi:hypothetical protein
VQLLLLSAVPEDKVFFEAAAKLISLPFITITSPDQAVAGLQKDPSTIIVTDATNPDAFKAFEKAMSEKIGLFSALLNPNLLFFIATQSFHDAPYLAQSEIFGHFIQPRPWPRATTSSPSTNSWEKRSRPRRSRSPSRCRSARSSSR